MPEQPTTPLAVGEEVTSDSPKVTLGPAKAVVASVAGVVTAVGVWLSAGPLADGAIDLNEGIGLTLAILGGLGVPGIGTYLTPTTVKRNR